MQDKKSKNYRIKKVSIVGVIPSFAFQRAKYCALELHRKLPQKFPQPEIVGLLELDWSEKLQQWRQTFGREYWCLRRPVAVFFDEKFIGSDIELIKLTTIGNILIENIPRKDTGFIKESFRRDYISFLKKSKRIYCYLDICVDDVYTGTLTFQLYNDIVPRTCENFKTLCLGTRGPLLTYKGSRIHRIVKKGWLQGGDIQYKTGGGGYSIFCDPLEDECFAISHDRRGVLSMANAGRHTNGSQFFITLTSARWMDTNFVAFGQLIEGSKVLNVLENMETMYECPLKKVEIKNCGKLDLGDVEDIDATYREEPIPKKKKKKIETISEQVIRLIMEALTDALARKERSPDVLDEGDIPSKMNIQLYLQGFYSLPESIFETSAAYLRKLRRQLLRDIKPSATEVVEVITYDLLMAVLTRMTTLDDIRETIGYDLYHKMVSSIDMQLKLCQKSYVRKLVNQIVSTAESMVDLITKKIQMMKRRSDNLKKFQKQMDEWVESFVLQEMFLGDNYFIVEKDNVEQGEMKNSQKKKLPEEKETKPKTVSSCFSSKDKGSYESLITDIFHFCRFDKKTLTNEAKQPLVDMIEKSRFKLRYLRHQQDREKGDRRLCLEKKIRKWMTEVVYTPETFWVRNAVFEKDAVVIDHVEEIMYGAMTAGLLEMYYFMEEYMKQCGTEGKKKKLLTRVIYPEGYWDEEKQGEVEKKEKKQEEEKPDIKKKKKHKRKHQRIDEKVVEEETYSEFGEYEWESESEFIKPPCTCGHPCCKCKFDPNYKPESTGSLTGYGSGSDGSKQREEEGEKEGGVYDSEDKGDEEKDGTDAGIEEGTPQEPPKEEAKPCASDETLINLKDIMAESTTIKPEQIDIKSLNWLRPYILEKSCDLKSEFAAQVHQWMEGERFNHLRFISNHSLPSKTSILSLSLSLAELIKEENRLKTDVRNFIYDLWELYFEEMFKEAYIQFPPEQEYVEVLGELDIGMGEGGLSGRSRITSQSQHQRGVEYDTFCKQIMAQTPDFDFTPICQKLKTDLMETEKEEEGEYEEDKNKEKEGEDSGRPRSPPPPPPSSKKSEDDVTPQKRSPPHSQPLSQRPSQRVSQRPPQAHSSPPSIQNEKITKEIEEEKKGGEKEGKEGKEESIKPEEPKVRKSPITVEELVDESSTETKVNSVYVLPFWVKFLTELTKQALSGLAKVSRLPRRLYFLSDTDLAFDEKIKDWFEFNAFNPQPIKGKEIMDFVAVHHKNLENLEDTARSFMKKKKYVDLVNRCTRIVSADDMAGEIVTDLIGNVMDKNGPQTMDLFVSNLVSAAVTSATPSGSVQAPDSDEKSEHSFSTAMDESDKID